VAVLLCPQELQNQWEVAKQEEESKGAGAADVRRWTGVRNIVEARELLRTLFKVASDAKSQVGGCGGCSWMYRSWLGTKPGCHAAARCC
jgi:hypothetical protein